MLINADCRRSLLHLLLVLTDLSWEKGKILRGNCLAAARTTSSTEAIAVFAKHVQHPTRLAPAHPLHSCMLTPLFTPLLSLLFLSGHTYHHQPLLSTLPAWTCLPACFPSLDTYPHTQLLITHVNGYSSLSLSFLLLTHSLSLHVPAHTQLTTS